MAKGALSIAILLVFMAVVSHLTEHRPITVASMVGLLSFMVITLVASTLVVTIASVTIPGRGVRKRTGLLSSPHPARALLWGALLSLTAANTAWRRDPCPPALLGPLDGLIAGLAGLAVGRLLRSAEDLYLSAMACLDGGDRATAAKRLREYLEVAHRDAGGKHRIRKAEQLLRELDGQPADGWGTEPEAAPPPGGTGTEPEASPAPAGRGTEPEALPPSRAPGRAASICLSSPIVLGTHVLWTTPPPPCRYMPRGKPAPAHAPRVGRCRPTLPP